MAFEDFHAPYIPLFVSSGTDAAALKLSKSSGCNVA
jgi:hypothetical protein